MKELPSIFSEISSIFNLTNKKRKGEARRRTWAPIVCALMLYL